MRQTHRGARIADHTASLSPRIEHSPSVVDHAPLINHAPQLEGSRGPAWQHLRDHYLRHREDRRPEYSILLAGGGIETKSIYAAGFQEAERAGRVKPKLAVVMSSYPSLADAKKMYDGELREYFAGFGFEPVFIPVAADARDAASSERAIALLSSCDALYLAGGDQARHTYTLLEDDGDDSPLARAIRELGPGRVIMGSSAGTATQGVLQYGEGDVYKYLRENTLRAGEIADKTLRDPENRGIGTIAPGADFAGHLAWIFCTHFDQRNRLGRLLVAMKEALSILSPEERALRGPHQIAVGVDEDTAMLVRGNVGTVHGSHGVFVVDASAAVFGEGERFSVTGLRVHYLREGDSFDFDTRQVSSKERAREPRGSGKVYKSRDLLKSGGLEITKMIQSLVTSDHRATTGTMRERGGPVFEFEVAKTAETERFGKKAVSASNLKLDVRVV